MIIWSRWGIVVLLFFGLGVGLGFLVMTLFGIHERSGAVPGIFIGIGFMLSAVALWFFSKKVVGTYIDKPQPAVLYEKLAEPIKHENNTVQTHRVIPVLHPETGQQIMTRPTSSFFFVPIALWVYLLPVIGLIVLVINLVVLLTGNNR